MVANVLEAVLGKANEMPTPNALAPSITKDAGSLLMGTSSCRAFLDTRAKMAW